MCTHTHTHTECTMKCEFIDCLSASHLLEVCSVFLTSLETAEHSTDILLTPVRHLAHSPPSISLPVSSLICFLIGLDWIGHGGPLQCSFTPLQDKVGVKWLDKIENYLNGYTGRSTWYQAVQEKVIYLRQLHFDCSVDMST